MKFYVASSFKNIEEVRHVSKKLKRMGYIHTYDWTQNEKASTLEDLKRIGQQEKNAVAEADFIVVLLPAGKGSHIELGIALGLNKRIILYSPNNEINNIHITSTFYHLPEVEQFIGPLDELIEFLTSDEEVVLS
ncbi:nucleoside 2-deoxyribosyltransferase [Metabacillus idriensis]|uniref:Group-specific protein n=1 Tax=Metabacillus idriensis TaxID=324768 RepID=A0A6I2MCK4_9BACI|nr:nucleoside 2-deoxyribosyltransferase [Metabacillus idriensis]MCM3596160.1 nucleoside 2-deoxyribosyltransferase [Metabacillus idriensis]MRX56135.1 group-specific protein [Metabacillus idriensis]OHR70312.1 group-specific protein [Bacillus sp. HMSC76G11]